MFKNPLAPAAFWTAFVTFLSTTSRLPALPHFDLFSADKLAHLTVYAVLVVLLARGFFVRNGSYSWQIGLISVCFAGFWGGMMELWQSFLPYRSFELDDEIANVVGAFLGWAFAKGILRY